MAQAEGIWKPALWGGWQVAYARRPPADCLDGDEPVPGKRKVPKCQARQVQHLGQTHFEAQAATRWSWSTRPDGDAQKRHQAAEGFSRSEQRLNVNFIKRNYKLVCQSVGRYWLRLGHGTGRWLHFRDTARKIPGSHIIKRARNWSMAGRGKSGFEQFAQLKWFARLSAITITDKKHQGINKNKRSQRARVVRVKNTRLKSIIEQKLKK